jgi:hypothetical protein
MPLFPSLYRFFPSLCAHEHTYRERRPLHGVEVMHFVCDRCGHATPAVERTADEHREVVKIGDHRSARLVRPQPGQVVALETRQRRRPA